MYTEFAAELERDNGRTYPQEPPMSRSEFEAIFSLVTSSSGLGKNAPMMESRTGRCWRRREA